MARTLEWKCDGCDAVERTKQDGKPSRWTTMIVNITGHQPHEVYLDCERRYDLCADCQKRLDEVSRPDRWERGPSDAEIMGAA